MHTALKNIGLWSCLLTSLLLLDACEPASRVGPREKDGVMYGVTKGAFRHRWWNYYERALSFADGGFIAEAEKDLQEALRQRSADQRRARTYGLHFVDYFPRREMGILRLNQGRIGDAVVELSASLKMEPSAKAQFYLDKARKALLEKTGADARKPEIRIDSPVAGFRTREFTVEIHGVATDDTFVREILVGGNPFRVDVSQKEIPFKMVVPVSPGENRIPVSAADLLGNVTISYLTLYGDRIGPALQIDPPEVSGSEAQLEGRISDAGGLSEVMVDGKKIPVDGAMFSLKETVPLSADQDRILVRATDKAGNTTSATILIAKAGSETGQGTDTIPPKIKVRDFKPEQITYQDQWFLEGKIEDAGTVKQILVNGEAVDAPPGKNVWFSHLLSLNPGDNVITILCTDEAGNIGKESLTVRRDIPEVRETGERLLVSVPPFRREFIGEDRKLSFGIEDHITRSMIRRARFAVVDREQMAEALKELKLSQSGLVEEGKALELGKILSADGILTGSVLERMHSVEIYARLIDTETTEVLSAVDLYAENADIEVLRKLGEGMNLRLAEELPVVEGIVVEKKGEDRIIVDFGTNKQVRKGMKLIIYRVGEPVVHPKTGKIIGTGLEKIARARIESVLTEMSFAVLKEDTRTDAVQPLLQVITR